MLPENVEYFPIGMYSDEDVRHRDKLEVGFLGVREEYFRLPDGFDEVWICQIHRLFQVRVSQAGIPPLLTQVRVRYIVLMKKDYKKGII